MTLNSGASITNNSGNALVTADNFTFTAGDTSGAASTASDVGTSTNRINTNVNTINGQAYAGQGTSGSICINQAKAVVLMNLISGSGQVNVIANGERTALYVSAGGRGGGADTINLTTQSGGGIDVGILNAHNGFGDVNLTSSGDITNNSGTAMVTADNFNFIAGNTAGKSFVLSANSK